MIYKLQPRRESKFCFCQVFWYTNICHMLWDDRNMSWNLLVGFVWYLHKDGCLLLHLLFHFLAKRIKENVKLQEISIPPPHLPTEGNGNSEGSGASKGGNFWVVRDCVQMFYPGGLSKIDELWINNSLSVEQAISYVTVTSVALIIFHLDARLAKCFFAANATVFFNTNVIG